jgi:hypothetical protein
MYFSFGYQYEKEKENLFCSGKWERFSFLCLVTSPLFYQGRKQGYSCEFDCNSTLWLSMVGNKKKHFPATEHGGCVLSSWFHHYEQGRTTDLRKLDIPTLAFPSQHPFPPPLPSAFHRSSLSG